MPWFNCRRPSTGSLTSFVTRSSGSRYYAPRWAGSRWPRPLPGPGCIWARQTSAGCSKKGRARNQRDKTPRCTAVNGRVVTAKRPNHVWHVDLTTAPMGGFWTRWLPFSLPQRWPFCWWVAVAVDHSSRRVMGRAAFDRQPTSEAARHFLGRTIAEAQETPKYLVCDCGVQFDCLGFREWCKREGIKPPRYGAIGKHGSIAVVERCILTVKTLLACLPLVPYRREAFKRSWMPLSRSATNTAHMNTSAERRPAKSTSGDFPPIVVLAMNRVLAGRVVRLARGLGHWCVAVPARE